jgi:hypothetical protein
LDESDVAYVEIACTKCERQGRLRRDKLIEQYGGDIVLPDLRERLARTGRCERVVQMHDPCGAYYPALKPTD